MTTIHQLCAETLKDVIDLTTKITVLIPKSSGTTSQIYWRSSGKTVRVGSLAFLNSGIDVCIYHQTDPIPKNHVVRVFPNGVGNVESMVADIQARIGRIQGIIIEGCND